MVLPALLDFSAGHFLAPGAAAAGWGRAVLVTGAKNGSRPSALRGPGRKPLMGDWAEAVLELHQRSSQ